jgi:hypothetical protein
VTHSGEDSKTVTVTLEDDDSKFDDDEEVEIRLCTLKGGKVTGLGIFAHKKDQSLIPFIKSAKVEIPSSGPLTSVTLLPPRHGCSFAGFLKWAGVWNSKKASFAQLDAGKYD